MPSPLRRPRHTDDVPGPLVGRPFAVGEAGELQQVETMAAKREVELLWEEMAHDMVLFECRRLAGGVRALDRENGRDRAAL
jgi:hypothetical protein